MLLIQFQDMKKYLIKFKCFLFTLKKNNVIIHLTIKLNVKGDEYGNAKYASCFGGSNKKRNT